MLLSQVAGKPSPPLSPKIFCPWIECLFSFMTSSAQRMAQGHLLNRNRDLLGIQHRSL